MDTEGAARSRCGRAGSTASPTASTQRAAKTGGPKFLPLNDFPRCAGQESNLRPPAPEAGALSS